MGLEKLQARVRFKNLLQAAEEEMLAVGVKKQEVQRRIFPLTPWLRDDDFWEHQQDGIAFYAAPSLLRVYNLPLRLEEQAVVSDRFYVKPLLSLLERDDPFAVLALSQKQVRFFLADHFSIEPAPLPNAPSGFQEVMDNYVAQRQQQFYTKTPRSISGVRRPAFFFGRGLGTNPNQIKIHLFEYCRAVDQAVTAELKARKIPLILAAAEPLQNIYRAANTYDRLLPQSWAQGDPDSMTPLELHQGASELERIQNDLPRRQAAVKRWFELAGSGRSLRGLPEILQAAFLGQVDTLFVSSQDHVWGRFRPDSSEVIVHPGRRPGDDDLLDVAATRVHLAMGTVFPAPRAEIPEGGLAAAILRYAIAAAA